MLQNQYRLNAHRGQLCHIRLPQCTRVTATHSKSCGRRLHNQRPLTVCIPAATSAPATQAPTKWKDLLNKTYYPTSDDTSNVKKKWYIINAEGQTLGRLATLAATYIRGKHRPTYSPSMDMGAYVIVINSEKVTVTGKKYTDKTYFSHVNGRPGSYRIEPFNHLQKRIPERIIEHAVYGMLPKGRLGRRIRLHLKAFRGAMHPHEAQQPTDITHLISKKPVLMPDAPMRSGQLALDKAVAQGQVEGKQQGAPGDKGAKEGGRGKAGRPEASAAAVKQSAARAGKEAGAKAAEGGSEAGAPSAAAKAAAAGRSEGKPGAAAAGRGGSKGAGKPA